MALTALQRYAAVKAKIDSLKTASPKPAGLDDAMVGLNKYRDDQLRDAIAEARQTDQRVMGKDLLDKYILENKNAQNVRAEVSAVDADLATAQAAFAKATPADGPAKAIALSEALRDWGLVHNEKGMDSVGVLGGALQQRAKFDQGKNASPGPQLEGQQTNPLREFILALQELLRFATGDNALKLAVPGEQGQPGQKEGRPAETPASPLVKPQAPEPPKAERPGEAPLGLRDEARQTIQNDRDQALRNQIRPDDPLGKNLQDCLAARANLTGPFHPSKEDAYFKAAEKLAGTLNQEIKGADPDAPWADLNRGRQDLYANIKDANKLGYSPYDVANMKRDYADRTIGMAAVMANERDPDRHGGPGRGTLLVEQSLRGREAAYAKNDMADVMADLDDR